MSSSDPGQRNWRQDVAEIRRVTEQGGDIDLRFVAAAERLADRAESASADSVAPGRERS